MSPDTGVLLVNLGTPNSPNPKDVYRYLIEFLTDERVIDYPWLWRQLLVRGIIVPSRYMQSADLYKRLWTPQGSPLMVHGRDVESKLRKSLGKGYIVELAMRYQNPSIESALTKLLQNPIKHLVVLPLFPQYASATTGSVNDKVMEVLKKRQVIPKVTIISQYPDQPKMIDAFADLGKKYLPENYDHILFSFHGLPERQIAKSDHYNRCLKSGCCVKQTSENAYCYKAQCYTTTKAIVNALKLPDTMYSIAFQSRLGKETWIQPYTIDVIHELAKAGKKRLLVYCPAFVCDCLETTIEIGYEYANEFRKLGGEELQLVEGLNSHPKWIEALKEIVQEVY